MAKTQPKETLPATKKPAEVVESVLKRVQEFHSRGELDLPPNYSAANALKSAWLVLQETVDRNKNPVLSVCTRASVANALLSMVVQGLNVAKHQGSFIAYGKQLTFQREYMGAVAICKRVAKDLDDVYAECIYKGDVLEYEIINGKRIIGKHTQHFENIKNENIVGAYATAINKDGSVQRTELMTMDEIKMAWRQSQMKPITENGEIKAGSTHEKFTQEMAKKTVTNRLAKKIINASSDSDLLVQMVRQNDMDTARAAAEEEVEENANTETIDIDTNPEPVVDAVFDDGEPPPMTEEEKAEIVEQEKAEAAGPNF